MSDGIDHAIASLVLAPLVAYGTFIRTYNPLVAIGVGAGCVFGIVMSPDLDINHSTYGENLLPGCVGGVWKSWWWLYSIIFKHRGISHWFIIGTITRFVYLFFPVYLVFYSLGVSVTLFNACLLYLFIGVCISDTAHIIMDFL